jgi:phosphoribosylaminoimidazolecarboxamide formyltransferase/IMP cyclohydrolase
MCPRARMPGIARRRQMQGKELSYNNVNDADAALELVAEFATAHRRRGDRQARQSLRRRQGATCVEAYEQGACLRQRSAFGGIVAVNRKLDGRRRARSPDLHRGDHRPRRRRRGDRPLRPKKNLRLLLTGGLPDPRAPGLTVRTVAGGLLVQGRDNGRRRRHAEGGDEARADRTGTADCLFAWTRRQACEVERHRLCQGRRDRRHRRGPDEPASIPRASPRGKAPRPPKPPAGRSRAPEAAVVASDAFFPFADGLLAAAKPAPRR